MSSPEREDQDLSLLQKELEIAEGALTELAAKGAIEVYLKARAKIGEYTEIADAAKAMLKEIIEETGVDAFDTLSGKASQSAPSTRVSYDNKALDALMASNPTYERILSPHRKEATIPGSVRITAPKGDK